MSLHCIAYVFNLKEEIASVSRPLHTTRHGTYSYAIPEAFNSRFGELCALMPSLWTRRWIGIERRVEGWRPQHSAQLQRHRQKRFHVSDWRLEGAKVDINRKLPFRPLRETQAFSHSNWNSSHLAEKAFSVVKDLYPNFLSCPMCILEVVEPSRKYGKTVH